MIRQPFLKTSSGRLSFQPLPEEGTGGRLVVIFPMQSLFRRLLGQPASKEIYPLISQAGHLLLSPIQQEDHALVERWFQDFDSCRLAFGVDTDSQTLASMTTEYLQELRENSSGVLMISANPPDGSPPLGFLRFKLFRQSRRSLARVGILLGQAQHRGRGLGTEAMRTLLRFLFEDRSVDLVELDTAHFNGAAQGCFLKCGFQAIRETEVIGLYNRWTERRIIMRLSKAEYFKSTRANLSTVRTPD